MKLINKTLIIALFLIIFSLNSVYAESVMSKFSHINYHLYLLSIELTLALMILTVFFIGLIHVLIVNIKFLYLDLKINIRNWNEISYPEASWFRKISINYFISIGPILGFFGLIKIIEFYC